jgi:hypothetical protein
VQNSFLRQDRIGCRYPPNFDTDTRVRKEAGDLARAAIEFAERVLKNTGDLARAAPDMRSIMASERELRYGEGHKPGRS